MNLLARFNDFIDSNRLIKKEDRLLLAVSGGRDSMLMAWLFLQTSYDFAIAHCNFHLRGEDANRDERLVRKFCTAYGIQLHVVDFETEAYARQQKISIQMAARELRYNWFQDLAVEHNYDLIAIAQHHNDQIETFFVNLFRGTGFRGLHGIRAKKENIIRPLLFMTAEEVSKALVDNKIPFRDDQSNFSTDYIRNEIRLDLIPKVKEVCPAFETVMKENMERFQEEEAVFEWYLEKERARYFQQKGGWIYINRSILIDYKGQLAALYQLFRPYGFSKAVLQDLIDRRDVQSGLIFESTDYEILLDRKQLILRPKRNRIEEVESVLDKTSGEVRRSDYTLEWSIVNEPLSIGDKNVAFVDADILDFPLQIRRWKKGDVFFPLGLAGRKKLSDFLINQKLNLFEKESVEVMVNGNGDIIWVIGYRLDDRYKISENTKKICKFVMRR